MADRERWEEIVADCVARRGCLGAGKLFTSRGTFVGEEDRLIFLAQRIVEVEAQRDLVAQLLRRTMTDTACVEVDGPGCWFCDRDDGQHADDCEAAQALAAIEERGGSRG